MQKKLSLQLVPSEAADDSFVKTKIAACCSVKPSEIAGYNILKRSIDARGRKVLINITMTVFINEPFQKRAAVILSFPGVANAGKKVIIIGAGPAGYIAALKLLEAGIQPVILERGKDVKSRRRDLAALNREGIVNPESNYCFGEGGAGTYSDGKLYTRSNKRGDINRVLNLFVQFGAAENILWEAHPHIGTNKLPAIITEMRKVICEHGGQILFEKKVSDFELKDNVVTAVTTSDGYIYHGNAYILATGHSARDIFELLNKKNILIEPKPFALGVRIEHQQSLIDTLQYHGADNELLPPASYSLTQQVNGKGVFSFCMCPGGIIAPASTARGEIVVNGWSPSKRNNPFANSGMVVTISEADAVAATRNLKVNAGDPLLFMHFQKMIEQKAFVAGGGDMIAPAQRLVDFCDHKVSASLPKNSYLPGLSPAPLDIVLPSFIYETLAEGFKLFGKKMKGFFTNEAVVVATESRTSSPVRIPRDTETFAHPQYKNLYPCGEGAGYAGGIISAAMDGENVGEKLRARLANA